MVTIEEWIKHFGFKRFPFDRPEAGNEEFSQPEFLASCFVEPENFNRILGQADAPVTTLVFADRGVGKTATRVMVDYYCRRGFVPADSEPRSRYVLSVPHIYLTDLVTQTRALSTDFHVHLEHHVLEILKRTVFALTELIASETRIEQAIRKLTPLNRLDIAWYMTNYGNLSAIQLNYLQKLGLILPSDSKDIVSFFNSGEDFNENISSQLASTFFQQKQRSSSLDHLRHVASLMPYINVDAIYVAVDGIDEFAESAGDPHVAYEVIRPLLGSLALMEGTPNLALKYYLPIGLRQLILEDPIIRKDRGFIITTFHWSEANLIQMLRRRLAALHSEEQKPRHTVLSGFDELCVPELHGTIEGELARYVDGNPRHLFVLCGHMVTAHCNRDVPLKKDRFLLNRNDFDLAISQFLNQTATYQIETRSSIKLIDLLEQEENEKLEFKSSLRWDFRRNQVNKALRETIGKAIAGMLNRHGGNLIIGVADDGIVVGLDKDIQTLGKKNLDGFHLELNHIIEAFLGLVNRQYLQVLFEAYEDKSVCIITIKPSRSPVYFCTRNRREFYVRLGNTTRELDVSAAIEYIQNHW